MASVGSVLDLKFSTLVGTAAQIKEVLGGIGEGVGSVRDLQYMRLLIVDRPVTPEQLRTIFAGTTVRIISERTS
jgi:hypothetical protein